MQAVIEFVVTVIAAFAMAAFAAMGGDMSAPRRDSAPAERVVARSPQKAKPAVTPKAAVDCPESRVAASDVA